MHVNKRDLLLLLVAFLIMVCIFIGSVLVLNSLQDDPLFRQIIPTKIIELLFYTFFVLLLFSNTIAATGSIYNAKNMELLLRLPISTARLYFAKLIEIIVETSLMFVIFISPVAFAYCYSLDIKPGFLTLSPLIILPFLVIPAGIAIALATLFVRFSSLFWKRGGLLLGCLIAVAIWALSNLFFLLKEIRIERGGTNAVVQLVGLFDNPNPVWLPSRWAVDLLAYFVNGTLIQGTLKLTLLWLSALGAVALGYLVFDIFGLRVRSAAGAQSRHESTSKNPLGNDPVRKLLEAIYLRLPINPQFRAIILKDLTSLFRDRAQSLQLIMYLGIAVVAVVIIEFMSAAIKLSPVALQAWWGFLASINILFTGFIVTAFMTRLVYPSISLEGKAFWILVTSPVELHKLVIAKFLCWLPLTSSVALMLSFAGVFSIYPSLPLIAATLYIALCMSIGCNGLAIGIGSLFASFRWESPTQISAGLGTLVLLMTSLALVVLTCIPSSALLFICAVPKSWTKFGFYPTLAVLTTCLLVIPALNISVSLYALRKGTTHLANRNLAENLI